MLHLYRVLIQAIQEQHTIIQSQEAQINTQQAVLQDLLQRMEQLENQENE